MTEGWDPVARDATGLPLSAGETCARDGCAHRWLDHDHLSDLHAPAFNTCTIRSGDGACPCPGFVGAATPVIPPSPFALPFPERPGRHAGAER